MGNNAAGFPSPRHGTVSAIPAVEGSKRVAKWSVPQISHPLLSIRQETQGQQSLRIRVDGVGIVYRSVAKSSGGKGLIIEGGGTAFACRDCLLNEQVFPFFFWAHT